MVRGVQPKMASRLTRFTPLLSLFALAACSSVLGIEDLHQGPAPGGGGTDTGGTGTGGTAAGADVNPTGGATTMSGGNAGKGQGGGSAGTTVIGMAGDGTTEGGTGGTAGPGGSGGTGAAGKGGTGGTGGTTVSGHVIDYWGHKLPGVPVEIGGTKVTTDAQGAFTIAGVPATYDASLVVQVQGDVGAIKGWVFEGLTRRDPTLQVYAGLQSQSEYLYATPANSATTLTSANTFTVADSGPDGQDEFTDVTDDGFSTGTSYWRGATTTAETAYGLIWHPSAAGLPTSYVAFDSKPLSLNSANSAGAMLTLDMSAKTIATGTISGTVTPGGADTRVNYAFVQFPTNAAITLVSDQSGTNTFSYLMPTITGSTIMFAAAEGDAGSGGFAVVHKDGLTSAKTGIAATIPVPASLLSVIPAASKNKVDATTQFTFQAGAGNTGPFLIQFYNGDNSLADELYVVTTKTTFTLPKVVNDSFALTPGDQYYWRVQTHGVAASVDAMAGTTGFMDEFSGNDYDDGYIAPLGPHHGDGAFTISGFQLVTLAP